MAVMMSTDYPYDDSAVARTWSTLKERPGIKEPSGNDVLSLQIGGRLKVGSTGGVGKVYILCRSYYSESEASATVTVNVKP